MTASRKLPKRFFAPLAVGAPQPLRELPVRLERMIHFIPPHIEKIRAKAAALGDRAGIARFGQALSPMDETLTRVALDASNRPFLVWKVNFARPKLGEMDTELFKEWFQAFTQAAGLTLHVENIDGDNNHHIVESCFKGLARALRQAVETDPRKEGRIPSTKGVLGGSL